MAKLVLGANEGSWPLLAGSSVQVRLAFSACGLWECEGARLLDRHLLLLCFSSAEVTKPAYLVVGVRRGGFAATWLMCMHRILLHIHKVPKKMANGTPMGWGA
eukprot:1143567-Pelagomonas_calceolata.AAC.1